MSKKRLHSGKFLFLGGIVVMAVIIFLGNKAVVATSTNDFCESCHIHPHSTRSWKLSTHYDNQRGIQVNCVDCHLPPHGEGYLPEKLKTGLRDVYGKLFKDPESLNWEAKSQIDYARDHTFKTSCIHCHRNNFPLGLNQEGMEAHLYYEQQEGELHCINCHITVGHDDPDREHEQNTSFGITAVADEELYTEPASIEGFVDFTEFIPGSGVSFEMVAIPGGSYPMGSPPDESLRDDDEGPVREVKLNSFFMGRAEVSWDEYLVFFKETGAEGKTADAYLNVPLGELDGISGPTPPWGAPDQGWGIDRMPAITMTYHAAGVYCQWLSQVTGKKYRLPTEAEWEYAARGGTTTPYFFEGEPRRFVKQGLRNRLFGADTAVINSYVIYAANSGARYAGPGAVMENPFGLVNMMGNVAEFCSDWYAEDAYSLYPEGTVFNPAGPGSGEEHVIRGGSFQSDAGSVRCASREFTRTKAWLKTDPQNPKSIWWFSDCTFVGFRVVCEYNEPGKLE